MKKHILLVDDDRDELKIFMDALNQVDSSNVKCTHASAARQALEMLKYLEPDIIFVDFNIPGLNGLGLIEDIKKIKSIQNIPVFLYSTTINAKMEKTARSLGVAGCIEKPNSINKLASELKQILDAGPEAGYAVYRK